MKSRIFVVAGIVLLMIAVFPAAAQDNVPSVTAFDQVSLDGSVNVPVVVSDGPGWIVIHNDSGGAPGVPIGIAYVEEGLHSNVKVGIDVSQATPVLFAVLHIDDNQIGIYEYGSIEGADAPMLVDGNMVVSSFTSHAIAAHPQIVHDSFTAANIVTDAPGWLAIHQEVDGEPGPVIGVAQLEPGNNADVTVPVEGEVTDTLFPTIYIDVGEAGTYEDGADSPVVVDGVLAATGVSTTPAIAAHPQIVVNAENFDMSNMAIGDEGAAPTFTLASVLSDGPGWVVIYSDNEDAPGEVAGFAPVNDGLTTNVVAELDPDLVTPILWPMLHIDDGEVGTYEFGTIEGADAPVTVEGNVVVLPVNVAPHFSAGAQPISEDGTITIASALIDASGWVAVHASVNDEPGPVVGFAALAPGLNTNVVVDIDLTSVEGAATDMVFPMLYYDTGEAGIFEFGPTEVEDGPVIYDGSPVAGSLELR